MFAGIMAGVYLNEILQQAKIKKLIILGVLVFTLPTTIGTLRHYLPGRPPAKISREELEALSYLAKEPGGVVLTYPFDEFKAKEAELISIIRRSQETGQVSGNVEGTQSGGLLIYNGHIINFGALLGPLMVAAVSVSGEEEFNNVKKTIDAAYQQIEDIRNNMNAKIAKLVFQPAGVANKQDPLAVKKAELYEKIAKLDREQIELLANKQEQAILNELRKKLFDAYARLLSAKEKTAELFLKSS